MAVRRDIGYSRFRSVTECMCTLEVRSYVTVDIHVTISIIIVIVISVHIIVNDIIRITIGIDIITRICDYQIYMFCRYVSSVTDTTTIAGIILTIHHSYHQSPLQSFALASRRCEAPAPHAMYTDFCLLIAGPVGCYRSGCRDRHSEG